MPNRLLLFLFVVIINAHTFERHSICLHLQFNFFFSLSLSPFSSRFAHFIHFRCEYHAFCCCTRSSFCSCCCVALLFADRYRIICRFITVIILPLVCHYWLLLFIALCCYYYYILFLYFSNPNAIVWMSIKIETEFGRKRMNDSTISNIAL